MASKAINFSTVLSTSALCATLAAAPIITGLTSNMTYALDSYMAENCTSEVLSKLGTTEDKLNSLIIDQNTLADAINSAKQIKDYNKYIAVFDKFYELESGEWKTEVERWNAEVNANPGLIGGDTQSPELQAHIAKLKEIASKLDQAIKDAGFNADYMSKFDTAPDSSSKADGPLFWVYDEWSADNPESSKYAPIFYALNYDSNNNVIGSLGYTKEDAFLGTVCSAMQIDPSFEVAYTTGSNPFMDASADDNKPSTDDNADNKPATPDTNNPTTIESNDKNVKVSGVNINANYTLNVNLVSDQVKLTGDDFKNSLSQAFYDIFVRDNLNNIVSNTGKVEVSIKLPSTMDPKNDFVVYYVPTGANGEHLTDQAEAITGVKVSSDGWLTFETDHFSVYGIVEYTKGKAPNTGVVAQSETSATTTSIKAVVGLIATLAVAGAGVVARRQILRKKANNK